MSEDDRTTVMVTDATRSTLDDLKDRLTVLSKNAVINELIRSYKNRTDEAPLDSDQPPLQALPDATLRQFIVFCPACGTPLAEFEYDDDTRIPAGGVLNQASLPCLECTPEGANPVYRYENELVAAVSPDAFGPADASDALIECWERQLADPAFVYEDEAETLAVWDRVARDAGWDWLLPLPAWTYVSDLEEILGFVGTHLSELSDVSVSAEPADDGCALSTWHYHLEATDGVEDTAVTTVTNRLSEWLAETDVTVTREDAGTDAVLIGLDGIQEFERETTTAAPS